MGAHLECDKNFPVLKKRCGMIRTLLKDKDLMNLELSTLGNAESTLIDRTLNNTFEALQQTKRFVNEYIHYSIIHKTLHASYFRTFYFKLTASLEVAKAELLRISSYEKNETSQRALTKHHIHKFEMDRIFTNTNLSYRLSETICMTEEHVRYMVDAAAHEWKKRPEYLVGSALAIFTVSGYAMRWCWKVIL